VSRPVIAARRRCRSSIRSDDYLRELRPLFCPPPRTFQRTIYRPGEFCQFDLWEPSELVSVGHGEQRRAWVVVACLPQTLVWDRQAGLHARDGRPTEAFAALCGRLKVGWRFCEPADPQAKGAVERLQGYLETNFERGRRFANERDYQLQLDAWFEKANARTHKTLRCRPVDRLITEREAMAPLPAFPDLDRRWVTRVPADPYLRFDTNDYSLDPTLAGRRVEVRVSQTELTAVCLGTGELAARHARVFARHRTITAIEHARQLRERRGELGETVVEQRPLAAYDALIA